MLTQKMDQEPQRILVVRRDNIGDLVCTTPAFAALRKRYPNAEIGALVNSYNAEVLRGNPNVDRMFVYQKLKHAGSLAGRFIALMRRIILIAELRRWKPDVTILAKSSYDRHSVNFACQIGAKNIIGYVPDELSQAKRLPNICLNPLGTTAEHEVEAVNRLLKPLGITEAPGPLEVFPNGRIVEQIGQRVPKSTRCIALHISAREPERRWGNEKFIILARHIINTVPGVKILLFWSPGAGDDLRHPGDDEAASQLIQAVQSDRLIPVHTKSLAELIAALSLCELFIGADGGAMHLAVALNIHIIAMFENSPSKLIHWHPWHVDHIVVCSENPGRPNVEEITQSQVEAALLELKL